MNVLYVVTRNEAALLRLNIEHHLAWGFDHVAVADNDSDDATPDVISEFRGAVTSISLRDPDDRLTALPPLVQRIEAKHGPASWVAVSDTDEFWWHPGPDLRATLARLPSEVIGLNTAQKLFLPTALDPSDGPVHCRLVYRTSGPESPLHSSYREGKSIYRASWARAHVLRNPHWCESIPRRLWRSTARPMIHHYMIDREDSFIQKVLSLERWDPAVRASAPAADHRAAAARFGVEKMAWWRLYEERGEAGLRDHYQNHYVIGADALERHLRRGDLVEDRRFAEIMRARADDSASGPPDPASR
ncbi:MAG: glycosyltransferase family 2 protein [Betaproteobacteria bacterium]